MLRIVGNPRVNGRVIQRVFGKRHFRLPCLQAGLPNSQPPTPDRVVVGDVPQRYACVKDLSMVRPMQIPSIPPCESHHEPCDTKCLRAASGTRRKSLFSGRRFATSNGAELNSAVPLRCMSGGSRTVSLPCIRYAVTKSEPCESFAYNSRTLGFVFATERGGPFTPDAVNRLIKRIGERAGFDFPVHAHMLRHACGFALAAAPPVRRFSHCVQAIVGQ